MPANDPWYWSTDSSDITDTRTAAAKKRLDQVTTGAKQPMPPAAIEGPARGQTAEQWGVGYQGGWMQKVMDFTNQQQALWDDPEWAAAEEQRQSQDWRAGKTFQWDDPMPKMREPTGGAQLEKPGVWSEQQPKKKTNLKPTNNWSF